MDDAAKLVREASVLLAQGGVPDPARDAEILLGHVLGLTRAGLHAHPGRLVPPESAGRFRGLVTRRAAREPLQYLTGLQEFWSLPFQVTPAVLIPRPETEHLIEVLLRLAPPLSPHILDLGTGSGCLAVAAAHALSSSRVVATDISDEAIEVARGNAARNGVASRVTFLCGDLFAPLAGRGLEGSFDVLLSNPPYIGEADLRGLDAEIRLHEPREALSPGPDALAMHRRLAAGAAHWLKRGGHLVAEMGLGQEIELKLVYQEAPGLALIEVTRDLAGIPRVLVARHVAV